MSNGVSSSDQRRFIDTLANAADSVASANDLSLAAMVACAIEESQYGSSAIYWKTGCPFNLQRPSWYTWVKCTTVNIRTCKEEDASGKCLRWVTAPFCYAEGNSEDEWLADAARLWCEWVLGWPQKGMRSTMLGLRHKPEQFTRNLPFIGFGEEKYRIRNGERFVAGLRRHALIAYCGY